jgi:fumarylpyruvate hydrolase
MTFVFTPPAQTALPVVGTTDTFPVHRVYCVGRNYAAHAREMGGDPNREPPFFFMKAADCLQPVPYGSVTDHPYPPRTSNYHFEAEMVVVLKSGGKDIPLDKALDCVFGYAVGLDMTRRDLQDEAKQMRRSWEAGKASDLSGPVGPIHPVSAVGHMAKGPITLSVNGAVKQKGDLSDMIWSIAEQISFLSTLFALAPGDVIFTGTPEGVGAVVKGDTMTVDVDGLGAISLRVV